MIKAKPERKKKSSKYSFTAISDYFLDEWSHVVGIGPTSLYIHLLKYCFKEKNLAWPTLKTLSQKMGVSERSVIRYQKILVKYGLIQNIFKRKSTSRNNIYQMTLGQEVTNLELLPPKMTDCPENEKLSSSMVTKCQFDSDKMSVCKVTKCHPNNNNLKKNNKTTTRKVVVDFHKRKNKGEEKMNAIRERMRGFDFTESFTEKVFKEYPLEKVAEKLELYAEGRKVRNPAGWFIAALREGYGEEEVKDEDDMSPSRFMMDYSSSRNDTSCSTGLPRHFTPRNDREKENIDDGNTGLPRRFTTRNDRNKSQNENEKTLSRIEAIKQIQEIRKNLMVMNG